MGKSDSLWLQNLAKTMSKGVDAIKVRSFQTLHDYNFILLDEICESLKHFTRLLNDLMPQTGNEPLLRYFPLGGPQPGVLVLKGKDKLVVSGDVTSVLIRIVRIQAFGEYQIQCYEIDTQWNQNNHLTWWCRTTQQCITAELVIKEYLRPFFASGSQSYVKTSENAQVGGTVRDNPSPTTPWGQ